MELEPKYQDSRVKTRNSLWNEIEFQACGVSEPESELKNQNRERLLSS